MLAYADASFLFSLYAQDANTGKAIQIDDSHNIQLVITPLQRYELCNAIRLAVFRGKITVAECRHLFSLIEADIKAGVFLETPIVWAEVYGEAENLSATYTETLGTRAFDVLHVAAASTLGIKDFYTFDTRQKALAVKSGMKVKP